MVTSSNGDSDAPQCLICHDEVYDGSDDVVTLACSPPHVFHMQCHKRFCDLKKVPYTSCILPGCRRNEHAAAAIECDSDPEAGVAGMNTQQQQQQTDQIASANAAFAEYRAELGLTWMS